MYRTHLLALLTLPLVGCAGVPQVRLESHRVALPVEFSVKPRVLEVRLHHGFVVVESGAELAANVEVEVSQKYARTAQRFASELHLLPANGSTHRILAVVPPAELGLDGFHVRYALTVPPDVELLIVSEAGDVTLREFTGKASIETELGNVRARLRGGHIAIESGSGVANVGGHFEHARISTGSGRIEIDLPLDLESLDGIDVETRSGDVRLSTGTDSGVAVEFATESGLLFSELPVDWISDCEALNESVFYRGVVGRGGGGGRGGSRDGGPQVRIRSGSGNLHLERRIIDRGMPFGVAASY